MGKIIKAKEVPENDRGGYQYQRYVAHDTSVPFNFLRIDVQGEHGARRVVKGLRNYYVVAGGGTFSIDGQQFEVAAKDLVVIETGEVYSYQGSMELIEFNVADENGDIEHEDV